MAVHRTRRTQEARSAETRGKLVDATLRCLDARGYAGTSTTEICALAGVSRGAQLHHFPTKIELVTSAVEHLFELRHAEFRRAFAELPPGVGRGGRAVRLLWQMVSGPTFHAWLELVVAARTDPELHRAVGAVADRFVATVRRTFEELFPHPGAKRPLFDLAPMFVFALLEGLALGQIVRKDEPQLGELLSALQALADGILPAPLPERSSEPRRRVARKEST